MKMWVLIELLKIRLVHDKIIWLNNFKIIGLKKHITFSFHYRFCHGFLFQKLMPKSIVYYHCSHGFYPWLQI